MTPTEMKRFRLRLEQEHADTSKQINALHAHLTEDEELDDTLPDDNDAATRLTDQEETSAESAQLQAVLAQIEKALARIDDQTYGTSEVSGKPIPLERLDALPYATTLVDE